jgi:glutathione synthase/RimK-type ligase-like ATP-grasp enzyme
MKKLLPTLLILFSSLSFAQSQNKETKIDLPVSCFDKNVVLKELSGTYGEKILFAGIDDMREVPNLSSFLALNKETETYTFGYYLPKNNMICIISAGNGNFTPNAMKDK